MPDIIQSFQGRDIGYLRIVARSWGIELAASSKDSALKELATALLDPELVTEIVDSLPADALSALNAIVKMDGKFPWAAFTRRFGEIREAGPGRRDREETYLHTVSPAEVLFYRGLLARAFFDTPSGAQEFAFIPEDLFKIISTRTGQTFRYLKISGEPLGRPATRKEREHPLPVSDRLVDDATTLLAALRMRLQPPATHIPVNVVRDFLMTAKIIPSFAIEGELGREIKSLPPSRSGTKGDVLKVDALKTFLEMPRTEALSILAKAWRESTTFNELHQVPGIDCEPGWTNQPLVTREFLLNFVDMVPTNAWWSLPAFILAIKDKFPDFQRPVGDYDSWFIKRKSDGTYLRGFSAWEEVDGALIRYLIIGPLNWLGQVELATPAGCEIISAFRSTKKPLQIPDGESSNIHVSSQGKIVIPRLFPRASRYQIARFCEWDEEKPDEYRYRVSTTSLIKAELQGLKVSQLLSLLAKNTATEIPPTLVKALKRWELNGTEARMEVHTILRVKRPEVLEELRKSKVGRFLGETLGPVTVVVTPGGQAKVQAALIEMGLLAENLVTMELKSEKENIGG